jgi:uncharacterized membrane protein
VEFEFLIGNGIGWLLKHKWQGFATKMIPVALFVWNTLYHAMKMVAPDAMPDLQGAQYMEVGWISDFAGTFGTIFATAALDTAKQMAVHSFGKNVILQQFLGSKRKR